MRPRRSPTGPTSNPPPSSRRSPIPEDVSPQRTRLRRLPTRAMATSRSDVAPGAASIGEVSEARSSPLSAGTHAHSPAGAHHGRRATGPGADPSDELDFGHAIEGLVELCPVLNRWTAFDRMVVESSAYRPITLRSDRARGPDPVRRIESGRDALITRADAAAPDNIATKRKYEPVDPPGDRGSPASLAHLSFAQLAHPSHLSAALASQEHLCQNALE